MGVSGGTGRRPPPLVRKIARLKLIDDFGRAAMHIVCVSGSNIWHARNASTSTRVCELIELLLREQGHDNWTVDIIRLVSYDLQPCTGCGRCREVGRCCNDSVFNGLYDRLCCADGLFIVSPHYAPIPSKLCMLLEKVEQIAFLPRFHDPEAHSPLYEKPVGIIGHGGGTESVVKGYKSLVLATISNALGWPVEMRVVGMDSESKNGVVFPIKEVSRSDSSPFPIQTYDWEDIREKITPLVVNLCGLLCCVSETA